MPDNDYSYYQPAHLHGQEVSPDQIIQHQDKDYHLQRVVCVTVVPPYNQALYLIDKGVEAQIIELLHGLGPYCRITKHQWMVATDEPCENIWKQLDDGEAGNVLVFAMLIESNWQFCCKPMTEIDEWEFDGVGVFFQKHLGLEE